MTDKMSKDLLAIDLMREAIALLDESGADVSASHLQMAIDTAECGQSLNPGDRLSNDNVTPPALP